MRTILFSLSVLTSLYTGAQDITEKKIADFLQQGSFTLYTAQAGKEKELAHSIDFFSYMAWLPGKDNPHAGVSDFNVTSSYVMTRDDKGWYVVLMVPSNLQNMNVKILGIDKDVMKGELLIPEFMFYDPQNPPKIPPPTYVYLKREKPRLPYSFSETNTLGSWKVDKVEGCEFSLPFVFTLKENGETLTLARNESTYMSWKLSPTGSYIHLEPADFSQSIIGRRIDEKTIEARSTVSNCRFIITR